MKRILTIQDISCLGKCSLTVALPLLSAMGVETVILPTAVLSTHTMFSGFTCKKEQITFDAIYTGYLGTEEDIETVKGIIRDFATENTLVFVDPAMGDNGKLYPAFDEHYAKKNATLCAAADVIVPNITEACYMTGLPYREEYDEDYVKELLQALTGLGCRTAILTGVSLQPGKTGAMGYDSADGTYFAYQNDRIPTQYHGTGDIFSSVAVGALMRGLRREDAIKVAADYTARTIDVTRQNPQEPWYGVDFEATIPELVDTLRELTEA